MTSRKNGGQAKRSAKKDDGSKIVSYEDSPDQTKKRASPQASINSPSKQSSDSRIGSVKGGSYPKLTADKSASVNVKTPDQLSTTERYKPIPYIFRMPASPSNHQIKNTLAKCPPFYLQLDHALAVIWCLFSKEDAEKPLGIAQLQWALVFLQGIYNKKGEHPKDVNLCIQAIQDKLIEQYADLVDEVVKFPQDTDCTDDNCPNKPAGDFSTASNKSIQRNDSMTSTIKLPFSVNYVDMMKNAASRRIDNMCNSKTCNTTDIEVIKDFEKLQEKGKTLGNSYNTTAVDSKSRGEMVSFLKAWRKEQLDKIQSELKRLHSIEEFMTNVDKDNFEPYLDENQLDMLMATKVKSNSEEKLEDTKTLTVTAEKDKKQKGGSSKKTKGKAQ